MKEGGGHTGGGISPFQDDGKEKMPAKAGDLPDKDFVKRRRRPRRRKSKVDQFGNEKKQERLDVLPKENKFPKAEDELPKDELESPKDDELEPSREEPELSKVDELEPSREEPELPKVEVESMPSPFDQPFGQPFDSIHTNVPNPVDEHRYENNDNNNIGGLVDKPFSDSSNEPNPFIPVTPEAFGAEPFSAPFSAPSFPVEPTPLDKVASAPNIPFIAPEEKNKEDDEMIEDKETDEQAGLATENSVNDPKESPYKEVDFEQSDPLTSFPEKSPLESPVDSIPETKVEVSDVTSFDEDPLDVSNDKVGFWEMLEDAGISKRHVFMLFGFLVAIISVVLFFVFGGYRLFTGGGDAVDEQTLDEQTSVDEQVTEDEQSVSKEFYVPSNYDQAFGLSGVVNSYIFGLEFSKQKVLPGLNLNPVSVGGSMVGVDVSLDVGQGKGAVKDVIVYYIDLLRKIDNARKLDVYEYLNQYVDRRAALQNYLVQLNTLLMEADASKNTILQELARIDAEYTATADEKDTYEVTFFDAMSGFNGEKAYDYLQLFTEASQKRVKQKADYNALRALNDSLSASISVLSPRIQDISINAEALMKGVKVFEVSGSNIDAIILQQ